MAQAFLAENPEGKIFVATDDEDYLSALKQEIGVSIVVMDVMRSKDNILYNDEIDMDRKSKEVPS